MIYAVFSDSNREEVGVTEDLHSLDDVWQEKERSTADHLPHQFLALDWLLDSQPVHLLNQTTFLSFKKFFSADSKSADKPWPQLTISLTQDGVGGGEEEGKGKLLSLST